MIQFSLHMIPSMISGAETPIITASSVKTSLHQIYSHIPKIRAKTSIFCDPFRSPVSF